jgi:hypothetical protein
MCPATIRCDPSPSVITLFQSSGGARSGDSAVVADAEAVGGIGERDGEGVSAVGGVEQPTAASAIATGSANDFRLIG